MSGKRFDCVRRHEERSDAREPERGAEMFIDASLDHVAVVAIERGVEQAGLAAKCVVQAGGLQTGCRFEITNRCRVVAVLTEAGHRGQDCIVEFNSTRATHGDTLATDEVLCKGSPPDRNLAEGQRAVRVLTMVRCDEGEQSLQPRDRRAARMSRRWISYCGSQVRRSPS